MPRQPAPSEHVLGIAGRRIPEHAPLFVGTVGDVTARFFADGQIVAEAGEKPLAKRTINLIFSVLARCGAHATAVRDHELLTITSFQETGGIGASSGLVVPRNPSSPWEPEWRLPEPTQIIDPSSIPSVVKIADECAKQPTTREKALRLLIASSAAFTGQHTEGFVMAWTIIEAALQQRFSAYWKKQGRSKKAIKDLLGIWRVSQVIDLLLTAEMVSPEDADLLHRLRKIRNGVVHELADASASEASDCLLVATHLVGLPSMDPPLQPQVVMI
jgi:hypothetical protein